MPFTQNFTIETVKGVFEQEGRLAREYKMLSISDNIIILKDPDEGRVLAHESFRPSNVAIRSGFSLIKKQ